MREVIFIHLLFRNIYSCMMTLSAWLFVSIGVFLLCQKCFFFGHFQQAFSSNNFNKKCPWIISLSILFDHFQTSIVKRLINDQFQQAFSVSISLNKCYEYFHFIWLSNFIAHFYFVFSSTIFIMNFHRAISSSIFIEIFHQVFFSSIFIWHFIARFQWSFLSRIFIQDVHQAFWGYYQFFSGVV